MEQDNSTHREQEQFDNYSRFIEKSQRLIEKKDPGEKYAIMYLDFTDFKLVNDLYSYEEGTRFLNAVKEFLRSSRDTVACDRIISDHFIRLFSYSKWEALEPYIREYQEQFAEFIQQQNIYHSKAIVYATCGVCELVGEPDGLLRTIDQANIARKSAKEKRQTNFVRFDVNMAEKIRNEKIMEAEILKYLKDESFTFYLQPKVSFDTGKIHGAEALARLIKEDGEIISPADFVPIMEQNGSIVKLDFLIYRQVCTYLKNRIQNGDMLIPISVNMSRVHLSKPDVAGQIHELVKSYGIPPHLLEFELTESVFFDDYDSVRKVIGELKAYGYKIAIDDFGTGYSGIRVWQELEFDVLKLDRQFVMSDVKKSMKNDIVIPRIAEISNDLRISMICEGVETIEQCQHMKNLGCSSGQGYYFSEPVSQEIFGEILERQDACYSLPWLENNRLDMDAETIDFDDLTEQQISSITRSIFHVMPGGVIGIDIRTKRLLFASDGFVEMTGYTREELFGRQDDRWTELLEFENKYEFTGDKETDKREQFLRAYVITVKDGGKRYVHMYGGYVYSAEWGSYILCTFLDETEQYNTQAEASQLNHKLNALVNSLQGGIARVVLNDDLRIQVANDGYYQLTGYTRDECHQEPINGHIIDLIVNEDQAEVREKIYSLEDGTNSCLEFRVTRKDGSIAWHELHLTSLYHEDDNIVGEVIFLDITAEKEQRIMEERQHSNMRMQTIGDILQVDVWEYNIERDVLFLPVTEKIFGIDLNKKTRFGLEEFINCGVLHPDDREKYRKTMHGLRDHNYVHMIIRAQFVPGKYTEADLTLKVSEFKNGKAIRAIGIARRVDSLIKKEKPDDGQEGAKKENKVHPNMSRQWFKGMKGLRKLLTVQVAAIVLCAAMLYLVFQHYHEKLEDQFNQLVEKNLTVYAQTQKKEVNNFNDEIWNSLNAIRVMAESTDIDLEGEQFFKYLETFNLKKAKYNFEYISMDDLEKGLNDSRVTEEDRDITRRLINGEEIISEVRYSSRLNGYYYSMAVPVIRESQVIGVLRNMIDARQLVVTKENEAEVTVSESYMIDSEGEFIHVREQDSKLKHTLAEQLKDYKVSSDKIDIIMKSLDTMDRNDPLIQPVDQTKRKGEYICIIPLDYNDWYIVNFAKGNEVSQHSKMLMNQMLQTSIIILLLVMIIIIILLWYVANQRKKEAFEAERYMVLAQFADTIMFQYNYQTDTATVTPNASKMFKAKQLEKTHYLKDDKGLIGLHPEDMRLFKKILSAPKTDGRERSVDLRLMGKDGEYIWCSYQYRFIFEGNHPAAVIGKITDISKQKQREEEILDRAKKDGLTGIYNKCAVEEKIKGLLNKSEKGFLFIFDLDNFKAVNDEYGHMQGDRVLAFVGGILKKRFRSCDIVGRIGGDEFVAYMYGSNSIDAAKSRADAILSDILHYARENHIYITLSMGIADYPESGRDYEKLYEAADKAMYRAKRDGKNTYRFF